MPQNSRSSAPIPPVPVPPQVIVMVEFPGGAGSFVGVLDANAAGSRLTNATFTLRNPIPRVIIQDSNGRIIVGAPVNIRFQLAVGDGFRPVGIAFKQTMGGSGSSDSNGRRNMPKSSLVVIDDAAALPAIEITNFVRNKQVAWKLFIVIQNPLGDLGVIDPEIENNDIVITPPGKRRKDPT